MGNQFLNNGSGLIQARGDSAGSAHYVRVPHVNAFHTFASYATAQTVATVGAPAAGVSLYIEGIAAYSDTTCTFTFSEDVAGTPVNKFKFQIGSGGGEKDFKFDPPIKLTAAKTFGVVTSATTTQVFIQGYSS